MNIPNGPLESTPRSLFNALKTNQTVTVKILTLSAPGKRSILWQGRVYTINDHPSFQENALLRLSWNKKQQIFEPNEIASKPEKDESTPNLERSEEFEQLQVDPIEIEEVPDEPPKELSHYLTHDQNVNHESEPSSPEENEEDEVKLITEVLRWAIPNCKKTENKNKWIQLPIFLPNRPSWKIRAGFLWNQQQHKITRAFIEIRHDNTVKIWWLYSDYLGKWYINKGAGKDGKSRVDIYL